MRKVLFFLLFIPIVANAAQVDNCINKLAPEFTNLLNSSALNYSSASISNDIASILEPKFQNILNNDTDCINAANDLLAYKSAEFSIKTPLNQIDIELNFIDKDSSKMDDFNQEFEAVMPWYGILVVKKGSLDEYANKSLPVIPTEYMKQNKDMFYPGNSGVWLGMDVASSVGLDLMKACTHANHTAADTDVINRAAHITANETDSFWSGNDYYIYDGQDVYWGTAQMVGEVALAVLTLGTSSSISAGSAAAKTTIASKNLLNAARATKSGLGTIKAVELTKDATKIERAIQAAAAAQKGNAATITAARTALTEAGVTTTSRSASSLNKIGKALEAHAGASAMASIRPGLITSTKMAWKSGFFKPWRLVKSGTTKLNPKNVVANTKLVGLKKNIAIGAVAAGGTGIGLALAKAYGYSTASIELSKNVKFSAFGLLSADDLEGRENEISHGAWLTIDDINETYDNDKLNETMAFAEAFKEDIEKVNTNGLCDIDIYVVQVGISNPAKMGTREAYYWLYTNPKTDNLRVNGK